MYLNSDSTLQLNALDFFFFSKFLQEQDVLYLWYIKISLIFVKNQPFTEMKLLYFLNTSDKL